jgi:hypothetical protein
MTGKTPLALAVAGLLLAAARVTAIEPDPGPQAKAVQADLVMAYEPCTSPDTEIDASAFPACSTPVRSDPVCGYGPKGKGHLTFRVSGQNLGVAFRLHGLDAGCEGRTMSLIFHWRVTGDDCGGAGCTLDETKFIPSFSYCTVKNGRCVLSGPPEPFSFLRAGARSGVELRGADVYRDGRTRSFTIGLVIP